MSSCKRVMLGMLAVVIMLGSVPVYAQSDAEHQQFLFAYKLLQRNENTEAAAAFDEYLGKFPNGDKLGDAQYYRALLYRKAGKFERAATLLESAKKPSFVPMLAMKLLQGEVHNRLKQYKQALAALETIELKDVPSGNAFAVLLLKGQAYRGIGNLKAAAAAYQQAAEIDTNNKSSALMMLANTLIQMDETVKAVDALDKTIALNDPKFVPGAARVAGDVSYNAGQYGKAVGYYNTIITRFQASEHYAPALLGMMWAQFGGKQYDALLKTYAGVIASLPEASRPTAAYLAGSAQQELDKHKEAVALLRPVAQAGDKSAIREKAIYKLAVSLHELGEYAQMQAAANMLVEAFPRTELRVDIAFLQASAEAQAGDVAKGVSRLTELIDKGPDLAFYGEALLRRAHLYEKHGKLEAAAKDYETYLNSIKSLTPTSLQALFRLTELLSALGQHGRVIVLTQGILKMEDPALVSPAIKQEALYRLAVAHRFKGDLDKAMQTHKELMQKHPINPYAVESGYEQGLIWMTRGESEQGVPLLLAAADEEKLAVPSRISAMRVVAQHDVDSGNEDRAFKLRLRMQQLSGPGVFSEDERLWLGEALIDRGESARAVSYLAEVKDESLRDRAKLLIGKAHRTAGEMDKAIATLNEVRAVSERYNVDAWLEIAKVYRDQGKLTDALRELAALQNPDRGQRIASQALYEGGLIHKQLGLNRLKTGDKDAAQGHLKSAREAFKKLWLLYPDREGEQLAKWAYLQLASLQHSAGDIEGEVQTLTELIEAEPSTIHATLAKAVLAERAGKPERADSYLRQVLKATEGDVAFSRLVSELIQRKD